MEKHIVLKKRILAILMTLVMVFGLAACGNGASDSAVEPDTAEPDATVSVDSEILGYYKGTGYDVSGTRWDPTGEWLELKGDGTGTWSLGPTEEEFDWTIEGDEISFKTSDGLSYKANLNGNEMILDTGMLYYFEKDGTTTKETEERGGIEWGNAPAGSIQIPSRWYGVALYTDCIGFDFDEIAYDVWGFVDEDESGDAYFELYLDPEASSYPIVSMYIDKEERDALMPVLGDGDAWVVVDPNEVDGVIQQQLLSESDGLSLYSDYDKGALDIYHNYADDNDRYAVCRFFVREHGIGWNQESDPLPQGIEEYKAEFSQ